MFSLIFIIFRYLFYLNHRNLIQLDNKNLANIISKMILMSNSIEDHINRRLCKIYQSQYYSDIYSNQILIQKNKLIKSKIIRNADICVSDSAGSGTNIFKIKSMFYCIKI
jgi:hypothetical protein